MKSYKGILKSVVLVTGCWLLVSGCLLPVAGYRLMAQKLPKNIYYSSDSSRLITGGKASKGFYDEAKLNSIYLEFSDPNYWDSLLVNHDKGLDIKANLKYQDKIYEGVGIRFKGMTSYMMTGDSKKKSFNISIDYTTDSLKLKGYKTLNLNNAAEDPSMIREVLYLNLIRDYVPAAKASFVKLFLNGEYWGIYSNIQQLNSEFLKEWFLSDNGSRWRAFNDANGPMGGPGGMMGGFPGGPMGMPRGGSDGGPFGQMDSTLRQKIDSMFRASGPMGPGRMNPEMRTQMDSLFKANGIEMGGPGGMGMPGMPGGRRMGENRDSMRGGPGGMDGLGGRGGMFGGGQSGLNYLGEDTATYQKSYTLKSSEQEEPWSDLVKTTQILNTIPPAQLEDSLSVYLDIDRTLWMLACEIVFVDDDGYVFKGGMDYYIYYEPESGRLVPLEYDGNSTFPERNPGWDPFMNEDNENYPLMNRILKVPSLRQRYLAHLRTIIQNSLNPERLNSRMEAYTSLIDSSLRADTKKLYSTSEFEEAIPQLKEFADSRKSYLMKNEEVNKTGVTIGAVTHQNKNGEGSVSVQVTISQTEELREMNLWYSTGVVGRFYKIPMFDKGRNGDSTAGDGIYGAMLPSFAKDTIMRYYIEAIAAGKAGTATYSPAGAEHEVYVVK